MPNPSTDRLKRNLLSLQPRFPRLARRIRDAQDASDRLQRAENGQWTVEWRGQLLHSRRHPSMEARWCHGQFKMRDADLVVVMGLGLGYVLKEFARARSQDLLVIEPDPSLLKLALMIHDFSEIFESDRFFITDEPGELGEAFRCWFRLGLEGGIFVHPGYHDLHRGLVDELTAQFTMDIETSRMGLGVWRGRAKEWVGTNLANIHRLVEHPMASLLEGVAPGCPVVIVGAGPSLPRHLPLLRELSDRAVILSVDAALKPLLRAGVVPDVVFSDEAIDVTDFFNGLELPESLTAVFPMKACPKLFDLPLKRVLLYVEPSSAFESVLARLTGAQPMLSHAYSVSTTAFSFALRIGANPILMVGQDLSFPGGRTHSEGVTRDGALPSTETLRDNPLYTFVKGYAGGEVLTWRQFEKTAEWFSLVARTYARQRVLVNATGSGVWIEGFEHAPLEEAAPKYLTRTIEKGWLRRPLPPFLSPSTGDRLRDLLAGEIAQIERVEGPLREQRERIEKYLTGRDPMCGAVMQTFGHAALIESLLDDVLDLVRSSFLLGHYVMGEMLTADWAVRSACGRQNLPAEDALAALVDLAASASDSCGPVAEMTRKALAELAARRAGSKTGLQDGEDRACASDEAGAVPSTQDTEIIQSGLAVS